MLGHTSLAQTATYLHAADMGLQESMRRFDTRRGKTVAKTTTIEQLLVGHDDTKTDGETLLH
jgi:hypothetical protein